MTASASSSDCELSRNTQLGNCLWVKLARRAGRNGAAWACQTVTMTDPSQAAPMPPIAAKRRMGAALVALRRASGLTQVEVSRRVRIKSSSLSRAEAGETALKLHAALALLDFYDASAELRAQFEVLIDAASRRDRTGLAAIIRDPALPDALKTYIGLEATADSLLIHHQFVPGLFQTEDYARAVIAGSGRGGDDLRRLIALRVARQSVLATGATSVRAVLDQSVLHRVVGNEEVTRAQMARLREIAQLPHITLQILPFEAGTLAASVGGGFIVLDFAAVDPPVVYLESASAYELLEGAEQSERFTLTYNKLAGAALPPDESAQMLADASMGKL